MQNSNELSFPEMTREELEAALLIEEATVEAFGGRQYDKSREFWKAVENSNLIRQEQRKRQSKL